VKTGVETLTKGQVLGVHYWVITSISYHIQIKYCFFLFMQPSHYIIIFL